MQYTKIALHVSEDDNKDLSESDLHEGSLSDRVHAYYPCPACSTLMQGGGPMQGKALHSYDKELECPQNQRKTETRKRAKKSCNSDLHEGSLPDRVYVSYPCPAYSTLKQGGCPMHYRGKAFAFL